MSFDQLGLAEPLLRAVRAAGYAAPTPIQAAAIPPALAGRDLLGCAQTGTGKTAAFSLPLLQRLDDRVGDDPCVRALVVTPTRELAAQIGESVTTYGKHLDLWHAVIFGGVNDKPQIRELRRGVDLLIATPGRLLDLVNRGEIKLDRVEFFVLDEADRMLDMGFLPDVKRIVRKLPTKRQTLFFSATMPPEIRELAEGLLIDPVSVAVAKISEPAKTVAQSVYCLDKANKRQLLLDLLGDRSLARTLVFSRTKHGANRVVKLLEQAGVPAAAIHGNKSQGARTRALEGFRKGDLRVLVATDLAARGLDVDGITHVINFDLPNIPETYVHRIGRTGRAGAEGIAVSFCDHEELAYLRDIEKLIGRSIPRVDDHPYPMSATPPPPPAEDAGRRGSPRRGGGRSGGNKPASGRGKPRSSGSTAAKASGGGRKTTPTRRASKGRRGPGRDRSSAS
ncbi:MAG: DEAD/DEAH box helicase [Nannocystaceae bacterium]